MAPFFLALALFAQPGAADVAGRQRDQWLAQDRERIARDRAIADHATRQREATGRSVLTGPSPAIRSEQRRIDEAARRNADAAAAEANRRIEADARARLPQR